MPARLSIIRFDWSDADHATAPDGTMYMVYSEHVRGEPRWYCPMVYIGRMSGGVSIGPANGATAIPARSYSDRGWKYVGNGSTSRQAARRQAERHWHDTRRIALGQRREFESPATGQTLRGEVVQIEGESITFDTGTHEGSQPRYYTVSLAQVDVKI